MFCAFPVQSVFDLTFPCGQCMPCRVNRKRKWTARIYLEWLGTKIPSSFNTLTYKDEALTYVMGDDGAPVATLVRSDVVHWLRRVRRREPRGLRYFVAAEYGDRSWRPHYHAILFGIPPERAKGLLEETWPHGFITSSDVNEARMAYVAGYAVKKMTSHEDDRLQVNQEPEFSLQSARPFIGAGFIDHIERLHLTRGGSELVMLTGDVAHEVRIGGRRWPLDRTMRDGLRKALGVPLRATERLEASVEPYRQTPGDTEQARSWHEKARLRREKGYL